MTLCASDGFCQKNHIVPDDGFFFGLGVFETIALEQGVPLFFREHLERMQISLERLGIAKSQEEIIACARRACQGEACRGSKVLKLVATERNCFATVRANAYTDARRAKGFVCEISDVRRNETSPLATMKTLNYADNILQKRAAVSHGIDEPIFLNIAGQVTEGATSNIFAVIDGEVVTPPASCGLLPGVMRAFAMQITGACERILLPGDLGSASEVFLTNSLMTAMPVCSIDGQCLVGNGAFPALRQRAHQVNQAYLEEVERVCAQWKKASDPWDQLFGN